MRYNSSSHVWIQGQVSPFIGSLGPFEDSTFKRQIVTPLVTEVFSSPLSDIDRKKQTLHSDENQGTLIKSHEFIPKRRLFVDNLDVSLVLDEVNHREKSEDEKAIQNFINDLESFVDCEELEDQIIYEKIQSVDRFLKKFPNICSDDMKRVAQVLNDLGNKIQNSKTHIRLTKLCLKFIKRYEHSVYYPLFVYIDNKPFENMDFELWEFLNKNLIESDVNVIRARGLYILRKVYAKEKYAEKKLKPLIEEKLLETFYDDPSLEFHLFINDIVENGLDLSVFTSIYQNIWDKLLAGEYWYFEMKVLQTLLEYQADFIKEIHDFSELLKLDFKHPLYGRFLNEIVFGFALYGTTEQSELAFSYLKTYHNKYSTEKNVLNLDSNFEDLIKKLMKLMEKWGDSEDLEAKEMVSRVFKVLVEFGLNSPDKISERVFRILGLVTHLYPKFVNKDIVEAMKAFAKVHPDFDFDYFFHIFDGQEFDLKGKVKSPKPYAERVDSEQFEKFISMQREGIKNSIILTEEERCEFLDLLDKLAEDPNLIHEYVERVFVVQIQNFARSVPNVTIKPISHKDILEPFDDEKFSDLEAVMLENMYPENLRILESSLQDLSMEGPVHAFEVEIKLEGDVSPSQRAMLRNLFLFVERLESRTYRRFRLYKEVKKGSGHYRLRILSPNLYDTILTNFAINPFKGLQYVDGMYSQEMAYQSVQEDWAPVGIVWDDVPWGDLPEGVIVRPFFFLMHDLYHSADRSGLSDEQKSLMFALKDLSLFLDQQYGEFGFVESMKRMFIDMEGLQAVPIGHTADRLFVSLYLYGTSSTDKFPESLEQRKDSKEKVFELLWDILKNDFVGFSNQKLNQGNSMKEVMDNWWKQRVSFSQASLERLERTETVLDDILYFLEASLPYETYSEIELALEDRFIRLREGIENHPDA